MTREEAKALLESRRDLIKSDYPEIDDYREALEIAIKALEQEPNTGLWIDDKCSVCGKGIEDLISSSEWYRNEEPNFCPFCGTKLIDYREERDKK